jgi:hypothetical protein
MQQRHRRMNARHAVSGTREQGNEQGLSPEKP